MILVMVYLDFKIIFEYFQYRVVENIPSSK